MLAACRTVAGVVVRGLHLLVEAVLMLLVRSVALRSVMVSAGLVSVAAVIAAVRKSSLVALRLVRGSLGFYGPLTQLACYLCLGLFASTVPLLRDERPRLPFEYATVQNIKSTIESPASWLQRPLDGRFVFSSRA